MPTMTEKIIDDTTAYFKSLVEQNMAVPVAGMNALVFTIKQSSASTWMELESELRQSINTLKISSSSDDLGGRTNISLGSGCELFMKYVARAFNMEFLDFNECKEELLRRGAALAGVCFFSCIYNAIIN